MFSYEKRIKAVKLLVQYDMSYAQTIRELGYPTRTALTNWYKEYSKHDDLLKKIKQSMTGHGFLQNIAIYLCKEYFETYGLIYETQRNEISSGENILKVLSLFEKIGKVEKIEIKKIGVLANEIYYNNGEHRLNNIKQSIQKNLINWIQEYDQVYTTNYDLILDDSSEQEGKVMHLHGGFNFSDRYTKVTQSLDYKKAYLVWGISGEEKKCKMEGGIEFSRSFPMEFSMSLFDQYLDKFKNSETLQIDIFGYSGENDQHINKAIANNRFIKQINYFCNPAEVTSEAKKFEIKERFGVGDTDKKLVLQSWNVIWDRLKRP